MSVMVNCTVSLRHTPENRCYFLKLAHYEEIRDALDRQETGWREFDSAYDGGKVLVRMEDIVDVFAATPEYKAVRDACDAEERAEKMANGE